MPELKLTISQNKNEGLIMSPFELEETYLFGVKIQDGNGNEIAEHVKKMYIRSAQEEIEKYLNIKLLKQIIVESREFYRDDFRHWNYIRVSYPAEKALKLQGFISDQIQIEYPSDWLTVKKSNEGHFWRHIHVVPNQGGQTITSGVIFSGITPQLGLLAFDKIPDYWEVRYCTGFDSIPNDILNVIGKLAAINLFHIAGDLILGAGIASTSIGIDGLSQSISTTSSATNAGYGARILGYIEDLNRTLPNIRNHYKGFNLITL